MKTIITTILLLTLALPAWGGNYLGGKMSSTTIMLLVSAPFFALGLLFLFLSSWHGKRSSVLAKDGERHFKLSMRYIYAMAIFLGIGASIPWFFAMEARHECRMIVNEMQSMVDGLKQFNQHLKEALP